ncbi:MAG: fumarylacetoacetate hydrolase family protein [Deltaproteobacteria bacterium]|nr:fumarylacetoacetate hydrolase family protein [Deltaproteobacteria bacterium]
MKLAQFYHHTELRLGIIKEDELMPLAFAGDFQSWLSAGKPLTTVASALPLAQIRLAAPVNRPGKIIAIGLNYAEHAAEGKRDNPTEPLIFAKFPNSVIGPKEKITWSTKITAKVDFEAELAVVIGEQTTACKPEEALSKVLGYTCGNDVSARDLQFGDKQWVRGKSLDTFCPLGPWLVTADEIGNPQNLAIRSRLNGQLMQESNTADMIFPVAELVSYLSRHFTLEPGDLIMTGTPSGVGVFREPPIFMEDGDLIEIEIEGIGTLKNQCRIVGS